MAYFDMLRLQICGMQVLLEIQNIMIVIFLDGDICDTPALCLPPPPQSILTLLCETLQVVVPAFSGTSIIHSSFGSSILLYPHLGFHSYYKLCSFV